METWPSQPQPPQAVSTRTQARQGPQRGCPGPRAQKRGGRREGRGGGHGVGRGGSEG